MTKIEIYSKDYCPFCARAKMLLDNMGLNYEHYEVSLDAEKEAEMSQRSGRFTVPQIFIDDVAIGGSDDLFNLVESGEFEQLIHPNQFSQTHSSEVSSHV